MSWRSKFGQGTEDEPAAGGGGVVGLGQEPEAHSPALELGNRGQQVRQRPAEAVQAPHHEGVAGQQPLEEPGELGAVVTSAGGDVGPDLRAPRRRQGVCREGSWAVVETRA